MIGAPPSVLARESLQGLYWNPCFPAFCVDPKICLKKGTCLFSSMLTFWVDRLVWIVSSNS